MVDGVACRGSVIPRPIPAHVKHGKNDDAFSLYSERQRIWKATRIDSAESVVPFRIE
jgi:hypothetical protein